MIIHTYNPNTQEAMQEVTELEDSFAYLIKPYPKRKRKQGRPYVKNIGDNKKNFLMVKASKM